MLYPNLADAKKLERLVLTNCLVNDTIPDYIGEMKKMKTLQVQLHFAEIMHTGNETFSSLGNRIFDVSIQGNIFLKDFNIMEEAGGVGKGIIRTLNSVLVNGSTSRDYICTGQGKELLPFLPKVSMDLSFLLLP